MPADADVQVSQNVEEFKNKVEVNELSEFDQVVDEFKSLELVENFNRVGAKVRPILVSKEKLVCEMTLEAEHVNSKGTLHGGLTASLTDIITARALGLTVKNQAMASIEIAVSYLLPVNKGDTIEVTATVLKCGRNIAFTEAEFRRKSDGKLASKGKHTIALLPKQPGITGKVPQF